jgi:hypothetical protein
MKIILATWLGETSQGESLTKMNYPHRLISFHYLNQQKIQDADFAEYCATGKSARTETKRHKSIKFKPTGGPNERFAISKIIGDLATDVQKRELQIGRNPDGSRDKAD